MWRLVLIPSIISQSIASRTYSGFRIAHVIVKKRSCTVFDHNWSLDKIRFVIYFSTIKVLKQIIRTSFKNNRKPRTEPPVDWYEQYWSPSLRSYSFPLATEATTAMLRRTTSIKEMYLYCSCKSRDTLESFTLFITVKSITKLNLRHDD